MRVPIGKISHFDQSAGNLLGSNPPGEVKAEGAL